MGFIALFIALALALLALSLSMIGLGVALVIQALACTAIVDALMFGAMGLFMLGSGITVLVVIVCFWRGDF